MKKIFKNDAYRKNRGGYSRLLEISCGSCGAVICAYQKDGTGSLKRMYVDRIQNQNVSLGGKSLVCPNNHLLGVCIIYKKENRPAFRLLGNAVRKKIIKP